MNRLFNRSYIGRNGDKSTVLGCFSPPVMLATFIIEILLAVYILVRYKLNEKGRLVLALIMALAAFQGVEYMICESTLLNPEIWSKIGFATIATLPPLGLHLSLRILGLDGKKWLIITYTVFALLTVALLSIPGVFTGHECTGNYVIFHLSDLAASAFGVYYYSLLMAGIVMCFVEGRHFKGSKTVAARRLGYGYLAFILPVITLILLGPVKITGGIPSIMCGFALVLAFILAFGVAPLVQKRR